MRTKSVSRISLPAMLVVAALALTGCSSGEGKKQAEEEGPLQRYMSALWGGEEQNQEFYDKQQTETEELVAKCMSKEGFEYKPNTQNGMTVMTTDEEEDGPEWGSAKFAETYGYGIIDWPGMEETQSLGEDMPVDPNQKYVESLSQSEQQAYQETLYGPQPSEEEMAEMSGEDMAMEYDWKTAGCYGAAQHEAQGESQKAFEDPEFKDLLEEMNEMSSEMYGGGEGGPSNEDMLKLDRKWSECMTEAGYDFPNPMEASNALNNDWSEAQNAGGSDSGEYKEPSKEVKKKFQAKEIKTAVADTKCQEKLNYRDEQLKISNKLEQKFLDEHKTELDAMLAKYGSKKKDK